MKRITRLMAPMALAFTPLLAQAAAPAAPDLSPRLAQLAPPVEIEARAGTGVIFNALLFHGTGKLGARRRVSCDLRFFPLCGFLPSEVHFLDDQPLTT